MNESKLVDLLQNKIAHLTKKDAKQGVDEILNYLSNSLEQGDRIELRGFGSFSSRKRKSRLARNPKSGSTIKVESKSHPYFRASKFLKLSLKD